MHTLQKLAAAGSAVAMMAAATPALANDGSHAGASMHVKVRMDARYDSECLDLAIGTRHDAKADAYAEYRADVAADVATRTSALATANTIDDDEDRAAAIKAAWMAYFDATADARAELKTDIKAANDTFATAKANCVIADDDDDNDDDDDGLMKGWNGKDNGWHRGWFKNGKHRR